jgi:hypothetical protein
LCYGAQKTESSSPAKLPSSEILEKGKSFQCSSESWQQMQRLIFKREKHHSDQGYYGNLSPADPSPADPLPEDLSLLEIRRSVAAGSVALPNPSPDDPCILWLFDLT